MKSNVRLDLVERSLVRLDGVVDRLQTRIRQFDEDVHLSVLVQQRIFVQPIPMVREQIPFHCSSLAQLDWEELKSKH